MGMLAISSNEVIAPIEAHTLLVEEGKELCLILWSTIEGEDEEARSNLGWKLGSPSIMSLNVEQIFAGKAKPIAQNQLSMSPGAKAHPGGLGNEEKLMYGNN